MDDKLAVPKVDYTRHEEIRLLFEETIAKFKKKGKSNYRDFQFFIEVLGDTEETRKVFFEFLHDVSTCPPEVIQWCQEQINPRVQLRVVK